MKSRPEATHTPLPWRVEGDVEIVAGINEKEVCIADIEGALDSGSTDRANAAFIVRAVNAHEEMLVLLKSIQEEFEAGRRLGMEPGSCFALQVRDAIAKAEGRI